MGVCAPFNGFENKSFSKLIHCIWSFDKDNPQALSALDSIPEVFFLEKLSYTADSLFSREELTTLLGFDQEIAVTRQQLCDGIKHLGYKEKFEKVFMTLQQEGGGWSLHLEFTSWWTLVKVRCKGSLFGKDRYRHNYRLAIGQRFDPIQHYEALKGIELLLNDEGYLAPDVMDILQYDEHSKTIAVTLVLDPGKRYIIRDLKIALVDEPSSLKSFDTIAAFSAKLKRCAVRELHDHEYTKASVQEVAHRIEDICVREGFLQATVNHEVVPDHSRSQAKLVYNIALGERRRFTFFGNHFFSERQLYERLLFFGKSISMVPPSLLVDELIDFYKDHGFWSVAITFQEEQERCFFCITEGARVQVKGVSAEGVTYFSPKELCNICSDMMQGNFFDKKKQRAVRAQVIEAYVTAGFWDFEIVSEAFLPCPGKKNIYEYHIEVKEGLQKKVRSVRVPGFEESLKKGILHTYGSLHEPIPFDINAVNDQRRALLTYMRNNGYLYAHPKPVLHHDAQGLVDVVWQIDNPTMVHFGRTVFAGASRLPVEKITRELTFGKGELWSQKKIQSSLARLKSLGIFESVSIRPAGGDQSAMRDVVLTCIDDDPFEIRARGGMQCIGQYLQVNALGLRYGGSLVWKNPTNRADRLQVALDISPHVRYGDCTYKLPRFFSLPLKTTFSLYSSRFDEALMNCFKSRLYRLTQDGVSCEFEYAADGKKTGCVFGFESMKVACISDELSRLIDFAPQLIDERVPYWYIEPVIMVNNLDDMVSPTTGASSIITAKAMVPLHARNTGFFKILLEQSFFVPVKEQWVLALSLRAGHIFYTEFSHLMPSERFYLGGAFSLRGYDTDMAPPVNICGNRLASTCLLPIGGKTVLSSMSELRFPLYKALGGVVFADCGILVRDELREENVVGATGFGLRYATPVGAARFDIAWKWHRQEDEKHRFAWFLTLGQAF